MPVIAVVNRKGGSGKSTLATHVAAWCARSGIPVMLGDVDLQQSARSWLARRDPSLPVILPWATDHRNMQRPPKGVTHAVLDTPGGMHGFELARIAMYADVILMPVCQSLFDRESASACHAELMTLPRLASGRCRLAIVGMRIDARTQGVRVLEEWSKTLQVPFLGALRETQLYVRSLERGMTVFDLPAGSAENDLRQWQPIIDWLRPTLYPAPTVRPAPAVSAPVSVRQPNGLKAVTVLESRTTITSSSPNSRPIPPPEPMVFEPKRVTTGAARTGGGFSRPQVVPEAARSIFAGLTIPQFFKRRVG